MLTWNFKSFDQLSLEEFHDIVALRINVFVVEQNCPYPELDGKDKVAYHLICKNQNDKLVATLRVLPKGISYPEVSLGRFVVASDHRGKGYAHDMMKNTHHFIEKTFGKIDIRISAQKHLENFYNNHNFVSTGKEYLEDGIPHVEMIYKTNKL